MLIVVSVNSDKREPKQHLFCAFPEANNTIGKQKFTGTEYPLDTTINTWPIHQLTKSINPSQSFEVWYHHQIYFMDKEVGKETGGRSSDQ
jgi:hypothetical protein